MKTRMQRLLMLGRLALWQWLLVMVLQKLLLAL